MPELPEVETVMRGQGPSIRKLLTAFASGGHVLLEDYPGLHHFVDAFRATFTGDAAQLQKAYGKLR